MAMSVRIPFVYIVSVLGTILSCPRFGLHCFTFCWECPAKRIHWTRALVTKKLQDVNDSAEGKLVFISESSGNFISMPKKCIRRRVFIRSIFVSRAILPLEYMLDHIKGELHKGGAT